MQKLITLSRSLLCIVYTGSFLSISAILMAQCNDSQSQQSRIIYRERGFPAFADSLTHAIQTNDTTFIFSRVHPDMFNGFGYNSGKKAFKRLWNEPYTPIDKELLTALTLGAAYDSTTQKVYAPYHFVTFPDMLNAFRYAYILEDDVPAYHQPDTTTSPHKILSKGWVEVTNWNATDDTAKNGDPAWVNVKLDTGETAVMQHRYLRSPIDYRFWFEKKNETWFLMGWAAGD